MRSSSASQKNSLLTTARGSAASTSSTSRSHGLAASGRVGSARRVAAAIAARHRLARRIAA